MSLSDVLPHTVLENGDLKYDFGSMYMIEPKGYTRPIYSDFFKTDPTSFQRLSQLVVVESLDNSVELQGVKSLSDLLLYSAANSNVDIIKIRVNLKSLLGENMSHITRDVYNNFLYMEGLDSDVTIGGVDLHITPDEIVPISYKALGFHDFRISNPDQVVTLHFRCTALSPDIETIGRFTYGSGMMSVSTQ